MIDTPDTVELTAGLDFREARWRPEVFQRFYAFHLRYRAHPGGVYYLIPWLAERLGWDDESTFWFAALNGNTQNPVTSLLLHRAGPTPDRVDDVVAFWRRNRERLAWDTDRRYFRTRLDEALAGYLETVPKGRQAAWWHDVASSGWEATWAACRGIPTFGRLSAWSFAEYVAIAGAPVDCTDLMLGDRAGSRSHRNGLCLVTGRDALDWHSSNPTFDGRYTEATLDALETDAAAILTEARRRAAGLDYEGDVGYLTLESALCTYKSWHRPNRRYPNVYNDMLHDRIRAAEAAWPDADLDVLWEARAACLPAHLRLEDNPGDPGVHPVKQNHYRLTGEVVMMDREWPSFRNEFNDAARAGNLGRHR